MSQLDDFKAAVTTELSDAQALLAKLASVVTSAQTVDPQVTDLITQLQASHTAIQAALNPAPATTTAPTAS